MSKLSRIATIADYVALFDVSWATAQRWLKKDKKTKNMPKITLRMVKDLWELHDADIASCISL